MQFTGTTEAREVHTALTPRPHFRYGCLSIKRSVKDGYPLGFSRPGVAEAGGGEPRFGALSGSASNWWSTGITLARNSSRFTGATNAHANAPSDKSFQ